MSPLEVTDRKSFIKFTEYLRENKAEWKNNTLEDFLEALASYAADVDGYYKNTNQNVNADIPSWRVFSDLLIGATMYE
jgi:hypothetical protein